MIAIIDSGVANLASVMGALRRLNVVAVITSDATTIRAASHVILPGVGAAGAAMAQLHDKNLIDIIRSLTQPVLGICLGMQLLFTGSEEGQASNALLPCLDVIPGSVREIKASATTPVPHMGWNTLHLTKPDHPLLASIAENAYVYFVHSFAVAVGDSALASCTYGQELTAVAGHKNFYGCQFHPERSGDVGSRILQNFLGL
jgi:glutamine amidotransferase